MTAMTRIPLKVRSRKATVMLEMVVLRMTAAKSRKPAAEQKSEEQQITTTFGKLLSRYIPEKQFSHVQPPKKRKHPHSTGKSQIHVVT